MSFSGSLQHKLSSDHLVEVANAFTGDLRTSVEFTIADSVTDQLVNFTADVSLIKAIIILSTQDVTLKTNDSGAPAETIVLLADNPLVWYEGSYYTNLLATDITKSYFSNASGSTATVKILMIMDSTP